MKRLCFLILISGLISMLAACSEDEPEDEATDANRVVTVETAEVEAGDFSLERDIYGRAVPERVNPVVVPSPGEVTELHIANGDEVEEGEELAMIATAEGEIPLSAPSDGQVASLEGAVGAMVSNEEPFALLTQTETMLLEFSVTARVRELFEIDETYTATRNGTEYEAMIAEIDSMPDDTGLYPVKATVENPNQTILPGMVMELNAAEAVIESALIVPTAAVVQENNETFVYVIETDTAEKRAITVEESGSDQTVIEGDVEVGDEVVVTGQLTLSDGDEVDVQKGE